MQLLYPEKPSRVQFKDKLIREFGKAVRYKIKIQKLIAFHYFSISLRKGEGGKNFSLSSNRNHNYFRIVKNMKETKILLRVIRSEEIKGHCVLEWGDLIL